MSTFLIIYWRKAKKYFGGGLSTTSKFYAHRGWNWDLGNFLYNTPTDHIPLPDNHVIGVLVRADDELPVG